jgi:aminoglycoside phosphotransferase (APT) family kinase protein
MFLLTAWVDGPTVGDIWDDLSQEDKDCIVVDLQRQFNSIRRQTFASNARAISNMSGDPIDDPRIPWVDHPRTYATNREFAQEIWPHLQMPRNRHTLLPLLTPLIEREVPIVLTHGDLLPKNIIIPVSKDHWRASGESLCIIDWETAGWMPLYWEALKATWLEFEEDTDWTVMMRQVFPECQIEMHSDWRWRSEAGIAIV